MLAQQWYVVTAQALSVRSILYLVLPSLSLCPSLSYAASSRDRYSNFFSIYVA
jgi:hypothetical protein